MEISYSKIGSYQGYQCSDWPFLHGFIDRSLNVKQDRTEIPGFPGQLMLLEQVHGAKIVNLDDGLRANYVQADGWLTSLSFLKANGLIIGIKTADCIPVFMLAKDKGIVAALHCGWKGIVAGIISRLIDETLKCYDVRTDEIEILIGPGARECCYEVGAELIEAIQSKLALTSAELGLFTHKGVSNNYYLGLDILVKRQFVQAGILLENIANSNICTICHQALFSYRREKDQAGRQLSFISALTHK